MNRKKKMIIAGGSGFLGTALTSYFLKKKYEIVILSRKYKKSENPHVRYIIWDAKNLDIWMTELEGADVLINLAGKSVNCRYTEANKAAILRSRTASTKVLGEAVQSCVIPPKVWMNSSTATIYEHSLHHEMTENHGKIGNDFSMNIAKSWEETFEKIECPNTTKIILRTSIVLGKNGGAFVPLQHLTSFGLGGTQGKGNQQVSWIHEHDFCRAVAFLLEKDNSGTHNITAPNPVRNKAFMQKLRKSMNVKIGIPQPTWLLKLGAKLIGTETELILKSRFVIPEKLLQAGFKFTYPTVTSAMKEILQR